MRLQTTREDDPRTSAWDTAFRRLRTARRIEECAVVQKHFGGDAAEFRRALVRFSHTLPQTTRRIFVHCELGGERACEVGSRIGLTRRQVQRHRRMARDAFADYVLKNECAPTPSVPTSVKADAISLTPRQRAVARCLENGEPAKAIAARLGISVRTVFREIKSIREHEGRTIDEESRSMLRSQVAHFLERAESAWGESAYHRSRHFAREALDRARALAPDQHDNATLLVRALIASQNAERQVGRSQRADDLIRECCDVVSRSTVDPEWLRIASLTALRTMLTWPGYAERARDEAERLERRFPDHPLFLLTKADITSIDRDQAETRRRVREASDAALRAASSEDQARFLLACAQTLHRAADYTPARPLLGLAAKRARAGARNHWFATLLAAEQELAAGDVTQALARIRTALAAFRSGRYPCEIAQAAALQAKALHRLGDVCGAQASIEEALHYAEGRVQVAAYCDMLKVSAVLLGGKARARVARVYEEAAR